jgi:chromosomal replication initiator protein
MSSVWQACLSRLGDELSGSELNTWVLPLQAVEEADSLQLFAPNQFVRNWVVEHYRAYLEKLCGELSEGRVQRVTVGIGSVEEEAVTVFKGASAQGSERQGVAVGRVQSLEARRLEGNLNARFTFDTFVEGKSNQVAKAASMQIGSNPGVAYNPLFVYGGVGLGKTHLMHAVGNRIVEGNKASRVVYVHAERFVSEMIKALQHNGMEQFKNRYRGVNALLIDDVQFFAGKERSQEEFFHTFNALFESGQQIVLSSDRFPKEVSGLEERLTSRLGWGLTVAIEPPDLETRVAILNSKASMLGIELPEDVAFFVAKRIRSNIRELEGALRRLVANSEFTGVAVSLDLAKLALRDLLVAQDKQVTIENIQKVVADYFKIRVNDLSSPKRTRTVARPRQLAMALAKELTKHSLPEIGSAFGGRDHSTVIHATKRIAALRETDPIMEEDYRNLRRRLTS